MIIMIFDLFVYSTLLRICTLTASKVVNRPDSNTPIQRSYALI